MVKRTFRACHVRWILLVICFSALTSCAYNGLFFPIDSRAPNKLDVLVKYHKLNSADNTSLNIAVIPAKNQAKAVLFVLHGSGSTVNNWVHVVQNMTDCGYEVVMMEYRGFADSEGQATHLNVVEDAGHVLTWLNDQYNRKQIPILVMGQSYGAQIAIRSVSQQPQLADGLITEGAFTSFQDIAVNTTPPLVRPFTWMTFSEPYNGQGLLSNVTLPKLIIHSDDDTVVPFAMGRTLFDSAPEPRQFWQVSGGHITATKAHAEELDKRLTELFL